MFEKKEYKCYRGEEIGECCNSRVEEAVARRTNNFILIVAVMFLIISLTVRTANNEDFVAQISFASTITSIILSVIAIWMSISGERSTNMIKDKVNESLNKLADTTNVSINLSNKLEAILETQNSKYDEIRAKMEDVICNIKVMKESFDLFGDTFGENDKRSNETDMYLDGNSLHKMVNNLFDGMYGPEAPDEIVKIKKAMTYIYNRLENENMVPVIDVRDYLLQYCNADNTMLILGILTVFSRSGVFRKVSRDTFNL